VIKVKKCFLIIIILALVTGGCTGSNKAVKTIPETSLLEVYTTVYPIYDFTKKIGGPKVKVSSIVPTGASPHNFEPSTRLLADLSKAQIIIFNGAGLEPYMDKMTAALRDSEVIIVDSSQGIELLELAEETDHHETPGDNSPHEHGVYDPHIWLSPKNALRQGENILKALQDLDPLNKDYYLKNYNAFCEALRELDCEYKEVISRCEKREIVVTHEAFAYLCRDYGLTQLSLMGLNAEAEPTPGKMRNIIDFVRAHGITHIYYEALESPKSASAIAAETNIQILPLNPLGGITEKELQSGADYFSIMKNNLESLKRGLNYR
jgi:zinc transport system substrate-binding protein